MTHTSMPRSCWAASIYMTTRLSTGRLTVLIVHIICIVHIALFRTTCAQMKYLLEASVHHFDKGLEAGQCVPQWQHGGQDWRFWPCYQGSYFHLNIEMKRLDLVTIMAMQVREVSLWSTTIPTRLTMTASERRPVVEPQSTLLQRCLGRMGTVMR